jgi:hypothetical protein
MASGAAGGGRYGSGGSVDIVEESSARRLLRQCLLPQPDAVGDPATCTLLSVLVWGVALVIFYFIIATRFHYSNDVFIGFLLTQLVFRVYHAYVKAVPEKPGCVAGATRWFEGMEGRRGVRMRC